MEAREQWIFDDTPLKDAANEMNRYTTTISLFRTPKWLSCASEASFEPATLTNS